MLSHITVLSNIYFDWYLKKWSGLFRSEFVLPGIALHLEHLKGAINIPDLYNDDKSDAGIITKFPVGAIGLAAAAVCIF